LTVVVGNIFILVLEGATKRTGSFSGLLTVSIFRGKSEQ
jgi:hypothetical protein